MNKTLTHQAIALAGLSQAAYLVQQVARQGRADPDAMEASIASALKIDADDVLDVYGGLQGLAIGLKRLDEQLSGPGRADPEQARYASTLIFLERTLMQEPAMINALTAALQRASARAEAVGPLDLDVLALLAEAYSNTLSQLKPRVLVAGEQRYLADSERADEIRALLLAGIRSAVLWRQCGGTRWKLLFHRRRLQQETKQLLRAL
jgi:high frequency lysogenization protein